MGHEDTLIVKVAMVDESVVLWLADTATLSSSEETDTSCWSDVCKRKPESSEDDDDDDDNDTLFFPLMQYLIRLRRKRVDDYLFIVESWTDEEFKNRLGLSRKTAYRLIGKLFLNSMSSKLFNFH